MQLSFLPGRVLAPHQVPEGFALRKRVFVALAGDSWLVPVGVSRGMSVFALAEGSESGDVSRSGRPLAYFARFSQAFCSPVAQKVGMSRVLGGPWHNLLCFPRHFAAPWLRKWGCLAFWATLWHNSLCFPMRFAASWLRKRRGGVSFFGPLRKEQTSSSGQHAAPSILLLLRRWIAPLGFRFLAPCGKTRRHRADGMPLRNVFFASPKVARDPGRPGALRVAPRQDEKLGMSRVLGVFGPFGPARRAPKNEGCLAFRARFLKNLAKRSFFQKCRRRLHKRHVICGRGREVSFFGPLQKEQTSSSGQHAAPNKFLATFGEAALPRSDFWHLQNAREKPANRDESPREENFFRPQKQTSSSGQQRSETAVSGRSSKHREKPGHYDARPAEERKSTGKPSVPRREYPKGAAKPGKTRENTANHAKEAPRTRDIPTF